MKEVGNNVQNANYIICITKSNVYFKLENFQWTGSFKLRGAINKISLLSSKDKKKGIVAYSSGNHAQGTAAAAHYCETPALIIMPKDAPEVKKQGAARWGAEIVSYDRYGRETREEIAGKIAQNRAKLRRITKNCAKSQKVLKIIKKSCRILKSQK